jgi:hypothetical protein
VQFVLRPSRYYILFKTNSGMKKMSTKQNKNETQQDWITGAELARRMGVSRQRIHALVKKGILARAQNKLIYYPTAKKIIEQGRILDKNWYK